MLFQYAKLFMFMCKEDSEQRWLGQTPVTCLHAAASNHHVMGETLIVEEQTEAVIGKAFLSYDPIAS